MVKKNLMRLQVLPNGLVVGHVFPGALGGGIEPGDVFQIDRNVFDINTLWKVGSADHQMIPLTSLDNFLVEAGGRHLTVDGE